MGWRGGACFRCFCLLKIARGSCGLHCYYPRPVVAQRAHSARAPPRIATTHDSAPTLSTIPAIAARRRDRR